VRELGRQLTAVGPLLLKTKVEQNVRLKIQADPIVITWKEEIPAIAANLLTEEGADVNYIIAYNNDPKQQRKGKIQLPTNIVGSRSLYDLYSLKKVQMDKDNEGRALNLELGPGEGRIYLLAKDADYNLRRDQITANLINNEKEAVKYELYQAWLAGVASPALVKSYRDADTLSALQAVRKTLSGEIAGNAKYVGIGADLDRIQKNLSELNGLYEQKITSLESTVPQPSEYPKRDFFASDPATRAYLDAFLDLGHLYFRQRNLYMTGKYGEIANDVSQLDTWVKDLLETAKKNLSGKPPVVPLKNDMAGIRTMCDRLDSMWAKKNRMGLDPEEMFRNKEVK
jgi:hypothetical protein